MVSRSAMRYLVPTRQPQASELATLRETVNKLVSLYSNLESQVASLTSQRLDPQLEHQLFHEETMLSNMLLNTADDYVIGHPCTFPPIPMGHGHEMPPPVTRSPSIASLDDTAWQSRPDLCRATSSDPTLSSIATPKRSPRRKPRHGSIASQLIGISRRRASVEVMQHLMSGGSGVSGGGQHAE